MTLQELAYAVAVSDHGHFGRAARACHVTQPTLSAGIKKLEAELEVTLFERTRRRVLPTPLGREIVARARDVLAQVEGIAQLARHGSEPLVGSFRLGVIPTVGPYLLPHVAPPLRKAYPKLRLLLWEQRTAAILDALRAGRLDAALLSPPVPGSDLVVRDLYGEPFLFAAPPDHPLASRPRLREAELAEAPMLLLDEGHCMREQALEVCKRATSEIREEFRATSLETLRNMVVAGVGCTLLPALAAAGREAAGATLVLRRFEKPAPQRTISLVWRRGFAREDSVLALADFLRRHLPPGVNRPPRAGAGSRVSQRSRSSG